MRIILAGAPGSQKGKAAGAILEENKGMTAGMDMVETDLSFQIGDLADYRTEIAIAADRTLHMADEGVHLHSLLDSVTYSAVRLDRMIRNKSVSEETMGRWILTTQLVTTMFMDSFKADQVLYLPGNDGTEFGRAVEVALQELLKVMEVEHEVLTTPEEAATLVREHGQRTDHSEPDDPAAT